MHHPGPEEVMALGRRKALLVIVITEEGLVRFSEECLQQSLEYFGSFWQQQLVYKF